MVINGQRLGEGAERGGDTGKNPTDRGKLGTKRHVLSDGRGVPLSLTITGANVHDVKQALPTIDAVVLRGPRGPRRPEHCCLDKGYDATFIEEELRRRRIVPHIRRRGEQPLLGCVQGKPRRWVVERTNAWHNLYRGLQIRRERISDNYLALCHLANALITFFQGSAA